MTSPLLALGVAAAAGLGSVARYGAEVLSARLRRRRPDAPPEAPTTRFPRAVLAVNVLGSAVLGVALALLRHGLIDPVWFAIVGAGFAGGLTTFSTWAVDIVMLWRSGRRSMSVVNALSHVLLGLPAVVAGYALTDWLL